MNKQIFYIEYLNIIKYPNNGNLSVLGLTNNMKKTYEYVEIVEHKK